MAKTDKKITDIASGQFTFEGKKTFSGGLQVDDQIAAPTPWSSLADSYSNNLALLRYRPTSNFGLAFGYASGTSDAIGLQASQNGAGSRPISINPFGGNVGIGTASPQKTFHVEQAGDNTGIRITHPTRDGIWDIHHSGVNSENLAFLQDDTSSQVTSAIIGRNTHQWYTGGTLRMTINSLGNVGIGNAPVDRFHVHDDGTEYVRLDPVYNRTTGNAANVYVENSGRLFRSTSALKYKKDIEPLHYGLETVLRQKPVFYRSVIEDDLDKKYIGFISDWEEENTPELIVKHDGEVEGFAYERQTAILTKAIQELSSDNDAKQLLIEDLKARIEALENK